MSESVKLHQDSPLGASTVFVIIPFSTDKKTSVNFHREDFAEWYVFGQDASCESNRQVQLMNPVSESLLRQLAGSDTAVPQAAENPAFDPARFLALQEG